MNIHWKPQIKDRRPRCNLCKNSDAAATGNVDEGGGGKNDGDFDC